jgi:hypothetical protein
MRDDLEDAMAMRPWETGGAARAFDHLHSRSPALAGLASKAPDACAAAAPSPRRRRRPAKPRALAFAAIGLLLGGGLFLAAGSASADTAANTVRAVGGAPSYGPDPGLSLNENFAGIAATASGNGYWVVAGDGGVFARGDARFHGSAASLPLVGRIVGVDGTPSGSGYWLAAADGGVFTYGDADFHGSLGGTVLNAPIVGITATPSGRGYWLAGADGGVFAFGDARFFGSAVSRPHASPFVGIAATRSGRGYYLLEANGGVFTFGDAPFHGARVDGRLATGIAVPPDGRGYHVARSDGSVAGFGGAPSYGAPADAAANQHPVIGIAARRGGGAWLARGYSPPPPPPPVVDLSQHPFLVCTRRIESGGNYRIVSPGGTYRGAYQFLPSTWNSVARSAGRPDLVGVDPATAVPHDQDFLALWLYRHAGAGPWGGRCAGL